ncbi:MAG: GTP cyclohydrolase, FolE2/MptA family [Desulfocapsaceae bacterium]|jgi:GTP cyclohydrolase I|nr:GTP cyclohydrolase, FolE2/MptA family [Desulfocapsaceae bacterium]
MKDIQSQIDHRRIDIKKVGVKTITYPITVLDKSQKRQKTIATVNMYVNLPHHFKGTHMSRFIEILNRFHGQIDLKGFRLILEEMKEKLDAEAAHIEIAFPFFLHGSGKTDDFQVKKYDCAMHCLLEEEEDLRLEIAVPVAHPFNDAPDGHTLSVGLWGNVLIRVRFRKFMWLEDLIGVVEKTIGRESPEGTDSNAAERPMESLLENLANRFAQLTELKWYSITVENISQGYSLFATLSSSDCP